ncbi:Hint domain-containing protein [Pelagovum pacificum]|uniref:Hedgehog/Intein (Hint) domain-containing protein n=1 Tax=Pelagovum pacificum TaxID=2588711 RepID=A0A5C5G8C5_9RHOB|nr:Hint domain-containing protein [Pelagovum pacificum]QQA41667.1 Hint domain-containing protein [Pelagovum pacificum]TNY30946.1 hypothetical protein FHY64_17760 [Pelagovum pacificum]
MAIYTVAGYDIADVTILSGVDPFASDTSFDSAAVGTVFSVAAGPTLIDVEDGDPDFEGGDLSQDTTEPIDMNGQTVAAGEVIVPAHALVGMLGITRQRDLRLLGYHHLLLSSLELLLAEDLPSESLLLGDQAIAGLSTTDRDEIAKFFPLLGQAGHPMRAARPLATGRRARRLILRHRSNRRPLLDDALGIPALRRMAQTA